MAEQDWVYISHPDLPHTQGTEQEPPLVHKSSFDEVWSEKGWTIREWTPPPVEGESV